MAHILFAGAGHGHLPILKDPRIFHERGHQVTLLAPEDFFYSGMATGVLARDYGPGENRVDIGAFAARAGVNLIRASVTSIDRAAKTLTLSNGEQVSYDLLSLAIGSEARGLETAGHDRMVPIKPVRGLYALKGWLEERGEARLAVIGGGLAGCEVALALKSDVPGLEVHLFTRSAIMEGWARAGRRIRTMMAERGIALHEDTPVTGLSGGCVVTGYGARAFDAVVMANGLKAPSLIGESGLRTGPSGEVLVNRFLQSLSDPDIFAVGDCMAFAPRPLEKAGVYAIRGAPVLRDNMLARLSGAPMKPFRPQRHYLWIMNLGLGEALAWRWPFLWQGRGAHALKDLIDRRFMASLT